MSCLPSSHYNARTLRAGPLVFHSWQNLQLPEQGLEQSRHLNERMNPQFHTHMPMSQQDVLQQVWRTSPAPLSLPCPATASAVTCAQILNQPSCFSFTPPVIWSCYFSKNMFCIGHGLSMFTPTKLSRPSSTRRILLSLSKSVTPQFSSTHPAIISASVEAERQWWDHGLTDKTTQAQPQ